MSVPPILPTRDKSSAIRWLRRNAEIITGVCVLLSLLFGGALIFLLHLTT